MPSLLTPSLPPSDRKALMIFAGVLLLGLLAVFASGAGDAAQGFGIPSTYSFGPGGARAAFLLLRESGYDVERWEKSPTELPPQGEGTVLILAQPVYPAGEEERHALSRYEQTGGRILAIGSYAAAQLVPEGDASPQDAWPGETKVYRALLPSDITLRAQEIELDPGARWNIGNPRHLVLYGSPQDPTVVTYRLGRGRVVWWAGAWPLTNLGISSKQNLELFLDSVGPPDGVRILWDEYFHGQRESLWAYLRTTPVPWAASQILLFAVALVATFGRRWGPLRPRRVESRLSPLEFIDTLGGLYERAHAAAPAVSVALQRFRFLLTRRLGLPVSYPSAELGREARARLGAAAEGLADLLVRAELAAAEPKLSDARALHIVQGLDAHAKALSLAPSTAPSGVSSSKPGREAS
jgi:hypothetical protein